MSFKQNIIFPQKITPLSQHSFPTPSKTFHLPKSAFNSKLFIDFGNFDENDYNNESFSDSTKSNDSESFDDDYYLPNELVSELEIPNKTIINRTSNNNIILNNLLPLLNNGYTFVPKNYDSNKKKIARVKKNDWVCAFCKNLNYSFRTKCNRCKVNKEDSEKQEKINKMFNNYTL